MLNCNYCGTELEEGLDDYIEKDGIIICQNCMDLLPPEEIEDLEFEEFLDKDTDNG